MGKSLEGSEAITWWSNRRYIRSSLRDSDGRRRWWNSVCPQSESPRSKKLARQRQWVREMDSGRRQGYSETSHFTFRSRQILELGLRHIFRRELDNRIRRSIRWLIIRVRRQVWVSGSSGA